MENKGRLTKGITQEDYGSKQEIIDSFGMYEGEMSREQFLANLFSKSVENDYSGKQIN